jgi:hypothetical protein
MFVFIMSFIGIVTALGYFYKPKTRKPPEPGEYTEIRDREAWTKNVETRWE